MTKLLRSKIPIHRDGLTFLTTPLDRTGKNHSGKVVHGLPQKKAHHQALENENAYKPVAVGGAGENKLEKVVHGLLQNNAAVLHLSKRRFNVEPLVETDDTLTPRPLTANEQAGNNILFTLRTTMKFHQQRLPVLFDTWLTTVNTSNVFLVTDGEDTKWKGRAGRAGMDAKLKY